MRCCLRLASVFFVWLVSLQLVAQQPDKPLSYTATFNAMPFARQVDNKIEGLCAALVEQFAASKAVAVRPLAVPWKRAILSVQQGDIDLVCGLYKTREREKSLLYSDAFASEYVALFQSRQAPFLYQAPSDLIRLTGVSTIGDSWGSTWDEYIDDKLNLVRVANVAQVMRMLANGRGDYAIATLYAGLISAQQSSLAEDILVAKRNLAEEKLYFAFSRNSHYQTLLPELNRWLKQPKIQQFIQSEIHSFEQHLLAAEPDFSDIVSSAEDN